MDLQSVVERKMKNKGYLAKLGREMQAAQAIPFSPYAQFMLATKGKYYRHNDTGRLFSRLQVWLRESGDSYSIKRILNGSHIKYQPFDKPGWRDGQIVDRNKVGI